MPPAPAPLLCADLRPILTNHATSVASVTLPVAATSKETHTSLPSHVPATGANKGQVRWGRRARPWTAATDGSADMKGAAAAMVREFYSGVNRHDLAAVAPLIAEACVYEDLIFPRPMVGRD
ncbi:hypothetical protein ZWY2020_041274 [Hordeum vulgare]|nr:hypothetical protein ZWY2020_041274 [Hordeum vulgare]